MVLCMPLTAEMLANRTSIHSSASDLTFDQARALADEKARENYDTPMLLAWFDSKRQRFSPNIVCCQEHKPSWLVYAESRGGDLSVDVNDLEYVFVYRMG